VALQAGLEPIPGYRLTQPLGAGAFGDVWEAACLDGQRVALKFIDCRTHSATMISSEVRVLRALAELRHPNIIQLLTVQASSRYLVLVMERADGNLSDLRNAYQQHAGGNIPPEHALDLLEQAAEALDFLAGARLSGFSSARGLQHCDIKPSNLLLIGNRLKVADFGLCAGSGWHTHTGGWKGTLPYAAPELYNGSATTGTDQYALAVTFCEMVMGDRPFFKSGSAPGTPVGTPIDLTKLRDKEFPIIARALHPYPSSRWPSCRAFIEALRQATQPGRGGAAVRIYPRGLHGSLRQSGLSRIIASKTAKAAK
jgi:serine/threonine protein kinase